jgi:hypothetical protein
VLLLGFDVLGGGLVLYKTGEGGMVRGFGGTACTSVLAFSASWMSFLL